MSLGTGALALIGGTVVVVGFLTLNTGALIAVQGYNQLSGLGVEALTGFVSGLHQRPDHRPGHGWHRPGATIGAGCHRPARRDAHLGGRSTHWK